MRSSDVRATSCRPEDVPAGQRRAPLRRRLRRRAIIDAGLALLLVPGVLLLSADPYMQLRLAIITAAFAVLVFMIRRSKDLADMRADLRAREDAMAGRGLTIAQWHAGTPLAPWQERTAQSLPAKSDS